MTQTVTRTCIKNLTISGELSKQNMNDARQEQKKILNEIKSIKKSLDYAISDTDDMQQTLNKKQNLI